MSKHDLGRTLRTAFVRANWAFVELKKGINDVWASFTFTRSFVFVSALVFILPVISLYKSKYTRLDKLSSYYYGVDLDLVAEKRGTTNGVISSTRQNAVIVALVRNSELDKMRDSIKQFERRFNAKFNYPYLFFNDEPFTDSFKEDIKSVTPSKLDFITLEKEFWEIPKNINTTLFTEKLAENKDRYIYGDNVSYRLMCRFESMLFYNHPSMATYEFYWRIEPDVDYYCNVNYDPFSFMKTNNYTYGFNIALVEIQETVPTLWSETKAWVRQNQHYLPEANIASWLLDDNGDYNMCHFWSNFEIVNLNFYRSEAYTSYVKFLDSAHGFFYERWGDAPIHSLAVSILLPKENIFYFEDIGYRHSTVSVCPSNSEMARNCACKGRTSFHRSVCFNNWRDSKNISKRKFLDSISS
ncbi:Glycolipid 2-alpha-mannosyltransferase [Smittium mucronatum]|uniref:Glycolipid 2-alpha-mannosyltransferase n=1 Tax=Smittium mucronatum TaxID=133383 RepID=A0A1R0GUA6_9FUNG|nr:Glycolipid 2-alpha-mannosyltransferase [Smittium mucronatum]